MIKHSSQSVGNVQRPDALRAPADPLFVVRTTVWRPSVSDQWVVFAASLVVYLAVAAVLAFAFQSINGDAWSRVANAYYVLFSRDPHLAAIGFVWNPLPSLSVMPLLPFKSLWPALVTHGFAANIVSAIFMAGAAAKLYELLRDLAVPRSIGLVMTSLFALNPMILLYGANGMSEAGFLFFLIVAARQLSRWLDNNQPGALASCGIALGFAHFTRYEAAAASLLVVISVAVVSAHRGQAGGRRLNALADMMIVSAPPAFAVGIWALASWVIMGSPFEIFSSIYGNSAQVDRASASIAQATSGGAAGALGYAAEQMIGLAPALLPMGVVAAMAAIYRRDIRLVAPLAVFAGVIAFALFAFLSGLTFGWLRFYICLVPLAVAICGFVVGSVSPDRVSSLSGASRAASGRLATAAPYAAGAAVALVLAIGFPITLRAMIDPSTGRGEPQEQMSNLMPGAAPAVQYSADAFALAGRVAEHLDRLQLPSGSVLTDAANAFPVILRSSAPLQFVITPDRDFQAQLADPVQFGVRYILVPPGDDGHDAVARAYPGIYANGAGIGTLSEEFSQGAFSWRLYRVASG